ncbi:MAG: RdgB/HAM1 family non-canonical purine NTP pyrophosphatase [Deltaproteobacteria bacterium]|jgi:XTP/dITP diphosphohydrolase|nr:RdgB/HAM1 family non-canonical purine NTP pyrophosphatase [Deltaproteobacteria bacterium]
MASLLIATHNKGKARELLALLTPLGLSLITLSEVEPKIPEPQEWGHDFLANARIKAHYYADAAGFPALADDSGLRVTALGGRPGVNSARYGREGLSDEARNSALLAEMGNISDRRAYFEVVLVLAKPEGPDLCWTGRLDGEIAWEQIGDQGFGYDPIFIFPPKGKTLAQLTGPEKNSLSHRAAAILALKEDLDKVALFLAK